MSQGLGWKEKVAVYAIGLVLGILLVSLIQRQRNSGGEEPQRFLGKAMESMIESSGLRNLPEGSPAYLRNSKLEDYLLTLPDASGAFEYIWILQVEEGYPRVRVVEELQQVGPESPWVSRGYSVMAADKVFVRLREEITPQELDAYLEPFNWARGEYYEGVQSWEVQLDQRAPLSVPKAIQRLEAAEELVHSSIPRLINWK